MNRLFVVVILLGLPLVSLAQFTAWGASPQQVHATELKREPKTQALAKRTDPETGEPTYHYLSTFFGYPALITYTFNNDRLVRSFVSYKTPSNTPKRLAPADSITAAITNLYGPPKRKSEGEAYWVRPNTAVLQMWSDSGHTVHFEPRKKTP